MKGGIQMKFLRKKKEVKQVEESHISQNHKSIKILGSGCANCDKLEAAVQQATKELQLMYPIAHITDMRVIASYGIMRTPALVVNERVISYGKVLSVQEAIELLKEEI